MALTRITKGVIKPNENYDTHNIVSTGIVTSVGLDVNGSADISGSLSVGGVLTYEDVTSIDSVGLITARSGIRVIGAGSSVGIGTTNPEEVLHVSGSGGGQNVIRIDTDGTALSFHNHSEFMGFMGNDSGKLFINAGGTEDTLSLKTNGNERLRITSAGNVGIGTTIPGSDRLRVHIDGTSKVLQRWGGSLGSTAGNRFLTLFSPATDNINAPYVFHTSNSLQFRIDGQTSTFCIDQNGKVGIGTDDPTYPLEVWDSDPRIQLIDTDLTSDRSVQLRNNQGSFVPSSSQHTIFYTGGSERVRITSSGQVGIGTTNPTQKLEVKGEAWIDNNSGDSTARSQGLTVCHAPGGNFTVANDPNDSRRTATFAVKGASRASIVTLRNIDDDSAFWDFIADGNTNKFYIQRGSAGGAALGPAVGIDTNLNVGIGTDDPVYGFDVRVDSFVKAQFKGKGANETTIPFYIMSGTSAVQLGNEPTGDQEKIILQASDDSMRFHTAGEERVRISNIGHVAIGTNFPNTSLPLTIQAQYPGIQFRDNEGSSAFNINADSNEFRIQTGHAGSGPSPRLVVTSSGNVLPGSDANLDLGSSSYRWANIYTADLQLSNEGSTNNVDGTWGQYTIQEGESDLFLINRRNGKKYKFMLEEVN